MPALDDYNKEHSNTSYVLSNGQKFALKNHFWEWYYDHSEDTILRVLFIKVIKVKHLRPLFILLFGEPV